MKKAQGKKRVALRIYRTDEAEALVQRLKQAAGASYELWARAFDAREKHYAKLRAEGRCLCDCHCPGCPHCTYGIGHACVCSCPWPTKRKRPKPAQLANRMR